MTLRTAAVAGPLALLLALAGPAAGLTAEPFVPLDITAALGPPAPVPPKPGKGGPPCRLHIAGVVDKRPDSTMGHMGRGIVQSTDAPGWVRAGLVTLQGDARWSMADKPEDADLVLEVEILKSYVYPVTTNMAASVVLRVRYSHAGAPLGEGVYRGALDRVNWVSARGEAHSLLNRTLLSAVDQTKPDLVKQCATARAPKAA